jgi:hypothetical protein
MDGKILLIITFLFSISYSGNSQTKEEFKEQIKYYFSSNDSLKPVCDEISKLSKLNLNIFNLKYSDSSDLKLYNKLLSNCANYELLALTYHESPMVKIFAYCGLKERNKNLLIEAIRNNIKDTSTVSFSFGHYYDEIYGNRPSVLQIAIEITYRGYLDSTGSTTLNKKDIKYISKVYCRNNRLIVKKFKPYEITIEGKLISTKFGTVIQIEEGRYYNGNYYYLIDKKEWNNDNYGKRIQVEGTVKLNWWFKKFKKPKFGTVLILNGQAYFFKSIEIKSIIFK